MTGIAYSTNPDGTWSTILTLENQSLLPIRWPSKEAAERYIDAVRRDLEN
jgi:hypothetical protein